MPVSFLTFPFEIIQNIILLAGCDNPIGPPGELLALLLTCRALYFMLCFEGSTALYAAIFAQKFDTHAINRRHVFSPDKAKLELRRRFQVLHCCRRLLTDSPCVTEALTISLFMITEDEGLNISQLNWARFPEFINIFLRRHIFDGADQNHGWPLENTTNALAITSAWLLTSRSSLLSESGIEREEIMRSLRPFAFAAFRYSPFTHPEIQFHATDPFGGDGSTSVCVHGPYPPPFFKPLELTYLGQPLTLRTPPIAIVALLSYFARLERIKIMVAAHFPLNRAVADAEGREGPTQQDIIDFNTHLRIHFFSEGRRNDYYWSLMVSPFDKRSGLFLRDSPVYVLGLLSGYWRGTVVMPDMSSYQKWLSNVDAPENFGDHAIRPLYLTLREHYCYSPSSTVPLDDKENGILNAWLPTGCKMIEHEDGIEFYDERGKYRTFYKTYRDSDKIRPSRYRGVVDVIVTGTTDANRGAAWGAYNYIGRVRLSDGATVLLKKPVNPEVVGQGGALMRGVVTTTRNFVGRWRGVSRGDTVADLETAFIVCKSNDP